MSSLASKQALLLALGGVSIAALFVWYIQKQKPDEERKKRKLEELNNVAKSAEESSTAPTVASSAATPTKKSLRITRNSDSLNESKEHVANASMVHETQKRGDVVIEGANNEKNSMPYCFFPPPGLSHGFVPPSSSSNFRPMAPKVVQDVPAAVMKRPSLRGRSIDPILANPNLIKSRRELIDHMMKKGAERIPLAELPEEFSRTANGPVGALGVGSIYEVICLDDTTLDSYFCTLCAEWTSAREMKKHVVKDEHRLAYMYNSHKMYHKTVLAEKDRSLRKVILQNFSRDIQQKEQPPPKVEHRMVSILNKETIERIWPGYEGYFYEEAQFKSSGFQEVRYNPVPVPAPISKQALGLEDEDPKENRSFKNKGRRRQKPSQQAADAAPAAEDKGGHGKEEENSKMRKMLGVQNQVKQRGGQVDSRDMEKISREMGLNMKESTALLAQINSTMRSEQNLHGFAEFSAAPTTAHVSSNLADLTSAMPAENADGRVQKRRNADILSLFGKSGTSTANATTLAAPGGFAGFGQAAPQQQVQANSFAAFGTKTLKNKARRGADTLSSTMSNKHYQMRNNDKKMHSNDSIDQKSESDGIQKSRLALRFMIINRDRFGIEEKYKAAAEKEMIAMEEERKMELRFQKLKTPGDFLQFAKNAMTTSPADTSRVGQASLRAAESCLRWFLEGFNVRIEGAADFNSFCQILANIDDDKKEDFLDGWYKCKELRDEPYPIGIDDIVFEEIIKDTEKFVKLINSFDKRMVMTALVEISNWLENKSNVGKLLQKIMKDEFGANGLNHLRPKEIFRNGKGPILMTKTFYSEDFMTLRQEYLDERTTQKGVEVLQKLVGLNGEQVDEKSWLDCKDLLVMILEDVPVEELLSKYQLLQSIPSSAPNVIDVLATILHKKSSSVRILDSSATAVAVAFARRLNEQECFESISKLLGPLASNSLIVNELESQLSELGGVSNSVQRFQRYQLLVEALKTESYKENLKFLLESLTEDATNSKVQKNQLSALKVLSDCAIANEFSARILNEMEISNKIYEIWRKSKFMFSSEGAVLVYACLRYFGHLTRQYPEAIDAFPDCIPFVADLTINFDLLDASQRILAFDTFSNICYSNLAKEKIENVLKGNLSKVLGSFGSAINHGPAEMRIRNVEAASLMFENATDEIANRWFEQFGQDSSFISTIVTSIQKPFIDIRSAFFKLLLVIFEYPKILTEFVRFSGFNEWLLNEESETEYETTQLKKQVIRKMIVKGEEDSKKEERILNFDGPYVLQLKGYLLPQAEQP